MAFINSPAAIARLHQVECFVLDMDGTFYLGEDLLPGSLDFYNAVLQSGRRILFLTNNSSRSGDHYVQKLHRMGVPARPQDVYTSGMATCSYLLQHYPGKRVALLGNEHLQAELQRCGITVDMQHPDVVVVGFDTTLDYAKMHCICDHLRAGLPYIATHPDFNCPIPGGFMPDIGAIMAFLQASTGRKADVIVGKPYAPILDALLQMTGLPKEKLCICGDRLYTDIAAGRNSGILSVCVLTGEATEADIAQSDVQPDLVVPRLKDLLDL